MGAGLSSSFPSLPGHPSWSIPPPAHKDRHHHIARSPWGVARLMPLRDAAPPPRKMLAEVQVLVFPLARTHLLELLSNHVLCILQPPPYPWKSQIGGAPPGCCFGPCDGQNPPWKRAARLGTSPAPLFPSQPLHHPLGTVFSVLVHVTVRSA